MARKTYKKQMTFETKLGNVRVKACLSQELVATLLVNEARSSYAPPSMESYIFRARHYNSFL